MRQWDVTVATFEKVRVEADEVTAIAFVTKSMSMSISINRALAYNLPLLRIKPPTRWIHYCSISIISYSHTYSNSSLYLLDLQLGLQVIPIMS